MSLGRRGYQSEFDDDEPPERGLGAESSIAAALNSGFLLALVLLVGLMILVKIMMQAPRHMATHGMSAEELDPQEREGGVKGAASREQRAGTITGLEAISADPRAVRNIADRVTLIGVRFERLRNKRLDEAPATINQPYPLDVNLQRADRAAAVTLTNQSVDLRVTPPKNAAARASFAIESSSLPVYDKIPKGALAGFRVDTGSYAPIAPPIDPWNTDKEAAGQLCLSLNLWAEFFGIERDRLSYLFIEDPTRIWFDGRGWSTDGVTVAKLDGDDIRTMCREAKSR